MSMRSSSKRTAVQPPSATNPRGVAAQTGPRQTQKSKGTAVISIDELDRIRAQITSTKDDCYERQRDAYRKTLQETSKNRVKNWGNTMEALRAKREEDRIKRLEDEEVSLNLLYNFAYYIPSLVGVDAI